MEGRRLLKDGPLPGPYLIQHILSIPYGPGNGGYRNVTDLILAT